MTTAASGTPRTAGGQHRQDPPPARLELAAGPDPASLVGAWWPRTRRPVAELSDLVAGLASQGVVATRLSLSVADWTGTPGRLHVDGRDVRLIWFAYGAPHSVVVEHGSGQITLSVIPPEQT